MINIKTKFINFTSNSYKTGFTIVELIVVITILAILGTIGFISFSSHLVGTRDTNRLSQLSTIYEGLDVYSTQNELPTPENNVEVRASGSIIGYQGYAGKNVLGMIQYSKGGKDPRDELYYSYYLTEDRKHFQLMGFLEDESNKQVSLITKTNATDYTRRYPTVIGKKLGILTESGTNLPIQEVSIIVSSGYLDVATTLKSYKANFTDQDSISGTGLLLSGLEYISKAGGPKDSCYKYLKSDESLLLKNGFYILFGDGIHQTYCDMTINGGGRTLIASYVDGSFFNNCIDVGMAFGSTCSTDCGEFSDTSNVDKNCDSQSEYDIQNSELEKLKKKYIINKPYNSINSFLTKDFVSKSYYNTSFSETMFTNDQNEYISYDFSVLGYSTNSMKDFYNSANKNHLVTRINSNNSNLPTSNNLCNTLEIAIMTADNDGGSINYSTRKYGVRSPALSGPGWNASNNGFCHYDDNLGWWGTKKLGFQNNELSAYILWFVK